MTEENLFEQLEQIYKHQPVAAGDIIHKQAKEELLKRGWIFWYQDDDSPGYCLTEKGRCVHGAKLLANKSAISGIPFEGDQGPTMGKSF